MRVKFRRDGLELDAQLLKNHADGCADLMVDGVGNEGERPFLITRVPFWKRREMTSIPKPVVKVPQEVEVDVDGPSWRPE